MQSLGVAAIVMLASETGLIRWDEELMMAAIISGLVVVLAVNAWVLRGDRVQEMIESTRGSSYRAAKVMLSVLLGALIILVTRALLRLRSFWTSLP